MSDEQAPVQVVHICPACEDNLYEARVTVVKTAGVAAALTVPLLVVLSFASAWFGKPWIIDDRLILALLAAFAAIIAHGFRAKAKN